MLLTSVHPLPSLCRTVRTVSRFTDTHAPTMYGFASALSGAPALAHPRTHAARRTRGRNNDRRRIVAPRCSISEPEPTADASAASPDRGCDPADPNDCIVTPRKVVNGQDLPAFEDVSTAHFRIRNGVVRTPLVNLAPSPPSRA